MTKSSDQAFRLVGLLDYYRDNGDLEKLDAKVRDRIYAGLDAITEAYNESRRELQALGVLPEGRVR